MATAKQGDTGNGSNRDRVLQDKLVRLWARLTRERELPPLDRWLGRELSSLDGLPRADRLLLGDLVADGVRYGALTLFCEAWRQEGWQGGADPQQRLQAWADIEGPDLWRRLCRLAVPVTFFWTFMRKREQGAVLPPISPPGPDALEVWRAVKTWAPASDDPTVRTLWAGLPVPLATLVDERAALTGWTAADRLAFLDQHASRPPLWLRLAGEEHRRTVLNDLTGQGFMITAEQGLALAVTGTKGIYELACHKDGRIDVQDLASQEIGQAVDARPGLMIWDCCAGAGGKSLQLAADLEGTGAVHATDLYEGKLKDLRKRARRAGWANLRAQTWAGDRVPEFGTEITSRGGFDRVLVDAPCSGSGTWRRNPDGRLRFARDQLADLAAVQLSLLETAAGAVRPKGLLIYATCSWLRAENEDVVAAFLAARPEFTLQSQGIHGNPAADSDTTFTAVLVRH